MNWIKMYGEYTKAHEAPAIFHLWCAISTIAAVLERKVWTRLMLERLYPNLYVILVAPPGRCRKNSAISLAHRLIEQAGDIRLCSEKITPEALIRTIANSQNTYHIDTRLYTHSSLTSIAKELDTFFSCNPEAMLELLTDLFDSQSHDRWTYETKGQGVDELVGVWFNLLAGTTPSFFTRPIIRAGIGGGFTSRCIFIYQDKRRGRSLDCDGSLENSLVEDLTYIHEMYGEFKLTPDADRFFRDWYLPLPDEVATIEALMPYYERKHAHVLKLSTIIAASSRRTVIDETDIQGALRILKTTEVFMPIVFRGVGGASGDLTAFDIERVYEQICRARQPLSDQSIINANYVYVPRLDRMRMILNTLVGAGKIERIITPEGKQFYTPKKEEEVNE